MAILERTTATDVIPIFQTEVFSEHPDSRFAIGLLAVGDIPMLGLETEHAAFYDIRRNVYVDQKQQLHPSALNEDGVDRDADDPRSVAFGIVENCGGYQRFVSAARLIVKGFDDSQNSNRLLPIEEFCPDVFAAAPAPPKSIEASRWVARHEDPSVQEKLSQRISVAALAYVVNHGLGPAYGVVDTDYDLTLAKRMPLKRIGEPRWIEHYLTSNVPIQIFPNKFADRMRAEQPGMLEALQASEGALTYFGRLTDASLKPAETVLQATA